MATVPCITLVAERRVVVVRELTTNNPGYRIYGDESQVSTDIIAVKAQRAESSGSTSLRSVTKIVARPGSSILCSTV